MSRELKNLFLVMVLASFLASCANSGSEDGFEEEVSSNTENSDLDLENLDAPSTGESTGPTGPVTAGDKEILNPEIDNSILLAPSDSAIAKAAKEMAAADAERARNEGLEADQMPAFDEAPPEPQVARRSGGGGGYRVPKIPGAALQKKGALLNRFIFVRQGDTPESMASLVYGDASRSKDLVKWNGGGWRAGKLIYFTSPVQATDNEMRSFYQERNVPPEEYSIEQADTLFKVAKKKYGAEGSWKEIAVINGFNKVEKLEQGTRIALYPADLKPFGSAPVSNNGYRRDAVPPPEQPTAPSNPNPVAQAPAEPSAAPQESVPPVTKKKKDSGFKLDPLSLIQQNILAIVLGGGVFVLLILLMALSKQKKKKALAGLDEFNEDLGSPKKSKRK